MNPPGRPAFGVAGEIRGFPSPRTDLPVISIMRNTAVPAVGAMSNENVVCVGKLHASGPQPKSLAINLVGVSAFGAVINVTYVRNVLVRPSGAVATAMASDCAAAVT